MSLKQNRVIKRLRKRKINSILMISLITIIYALGEFIYLANIAHEAHIKWEELAFHATALGFLLLIVSYLLEIFDSIEHYGMGPERTARKERELFIQQHSTETIVRVLQQWHKEIAEALRFSHDGRSFIVAHEVLALRSYEIFWELLAKEQESRGKNNPLNVLIIHSSSLEIWSEYAIRKNLFASQRQFTDHGGKAIRILCAEGKLCSSVEKSTSEEKELSPEMQNTIRKVAKDMGQVGVEVYYYNITQLKVSFDFSWDFAYVKETEAAVIWESFNPGGKINASTYQIGKHFRGQDLEKLWNNIFKNKENISK